VGEGHAILIDKKQHALQQGSFGRTMQWNSSRMIELSNVFIPLDLQTNTPGLFAA
jgi:hypothetical protein